MFKLAITDLSVSIKDLDEAAIREHIANTKDDQWALPFVDVIVEDIGNFNPGMGSLDQYTLRRFAVHAFNRNAYYKARSTQTDGRGHQFMDLLMAYGSPMEGALPANLRYKEEPLPYLIYETFGKFNFDSYIKNVPELGEKWRRWGWEMKSDYVD